MKKTVEDGVQWYRRGDVNVARMHEGELSIFHEARPDEVAALAKAASKLKRLVLRGQHLGGPSPRCPSSRSSSTSRSNRCSGPTRARPCNSSPRSAASA